MKKDELAKAPPATALQTMSGLTPGQYATLGEIASNEGVPTSGLTILGGKPYINTTGLDVKLRTKCEKEKLIHIGTDYEVIQEATEANKMHASGWGRIRFFDKHGFETALKLLATKGVVDRPVLEMLKEMYFHEFRMRGHASPETLQMASMRTKDNIEGMAERRATNRAKREAVGTGLTSLEEIEGQELLEAIPPQEDKNKAVVAGILDLAGRKQKMFDAFAILGVTRPQIAARLKAAGKKEETLTVEDLDDYTRIYLAIKSGEKKIEDVFLPTEAISPALTLVPKPSEAVEGGPSKTYVVLHAKIDKCKTKKLLEKLLDTIADAYANKLISGEEAKALTIFAEQSLVDAK